MGRANTQTINALPVTPTPRNTPEAASLAVWTSQPAQPALAQSTGEVNAPSQRDSMDFIWARFAGLTLDDGLVNLVAQGRGR